MIDLERHAESILARSLKSGGDLGEIFFQTSRHTSIKLEDGKVEKTVTGVETGAGIRVLAGPRTFYAHTNDVTLDGLLEAAATVARAVEGQAGSYDYDFHIERYEMPVTKKPAEVPTSEKVKLVRAADNVARNADRRVAQVAVTYADASSRVIIVNSDGRFVEDVRPQIVLAVRVVAAADGLIQTGLRILGGAQGYELFDRENPETAAGDAARQAVLMLEADPAPTGRMPVVLAGEAGGTMIHEAVGHGLEADHIEKGMSKYCGRLEEVIAVPEINVVDDGTIPGKRGTASVDDEGTPRQRTVLIENGRLVNFMNDLRTARIMGIRPTGNGRRQSYRHKPIPRMTNTMILPGESDANAILADVAHGLYVRRMGGGQVNPLNGDFVFEVSEGYLIESGKAGAPVRGATLVGNGPDVLMNIDAIGDDLGFAIGTCGKAGQAAPVSDAQPTIRIKQLTIGGTAPQT